ncbi:MAG: glycosyltransferase [Synergistaceae bacterium]|nr:glycosyltransferase [Synergistaceae bacterium]
MTPVKNQERRIFKVIHILPELSEGGVERHVTELANELHAQGHDVMVVSAGGGLVRELKTQHIQMPVHRKSIGRGLSCAERLASIARRGNVDLFHVHSRVPAWIAYFARMLSSVPFVVTAHARYSLNLGLWPLSRSDGAICVSQTVREHLSDWLPGNRVRVIYNAAPSSENIIPWRGGNKPKRLLYLGRLSRKKGVDVLLEALSSIEKSGIGSEDRSDERAWSLDVVGDGPASAELRDRAEKLFSGFSGFPGGRKRVLFHGHSDSPGDWIAQSDLFLFSSFDEGMPLSLLEALRAGIPILASDIPAVRELFRGDAGTHANLVTAGDIDAWARAIGGFLKGETLPRLSPAIVLPTINELAREVLQFYEDVLSKSAFL